jgi:ketosteroid isomerase-like protein
MKRKAFLALALLAITALAWHYHRRLFQDDDKTIRIMIEDMRQAAEAKDASRLLKHFSPDYNDRDGNNKFIISQMVTRSLASVSELRVSVKNVDVLVTGERAWATLTVTAEALKDGKVFFPFGSLEDPETPRLTFKKTSTGDWKIISVENIKNSGF